MNSRVFLFFLLFFFLLFLQFPVSNSLIGNTDAIGTLVVYREHLLQLKEQVFGIPYGNVFYPERGLTDFCEAYWGETVIYGIISLLGFSDLINIFILISLVFALNGFSVFCLANYYTQNVYASITAGIAFSASSYMLCNHEMMNALAFFPLPFTLLFLERYLAERIPKFLFYSAVALGVQLYFATYNFVFGVFTSIALIAFNYKQVVELFKEHYKYYLMAAVLAAVIALPGFYSILFSGKLENVFNPLVELPGITKMYSLNFTNFTASWPNNLVYRKGGLFGDTALKNQYYTNLGFVFVGIAFLGLIKGGKFKLLYAMFALAAIVISFGPLLEVGSTTITMPLYWFYKIEGIKNFYRIPGRTFVLAAFSLSILLALGLVYIKLKIRHFKLILAIVTGVIVLENVPFPFSKDTGNAMSLIPPKEYIDFYKKQRLKKIAELPSSLFTDRFQYVNGISEYSREYRYMYWQTLHKNYVINGSASFFPKSRMYNNSLTKDITAGENLQKLIEYNKLDYVTFHKNLVLAKEEKTIEGFLASSSLLKKVMESKDVIIFRVSRST